QSDVTVGGHGECIVAAGPIGRQAAVGDAARQGQGRGGPKAREADGQGVGLDGAGVGGRAGRGDVAGRASDGKGGAAASADGQVSDRFVAGGDGAAGAQGARDGAGGGVDSHGGTDAVDDERIVGAGVAAGDGDIGQPGGRVGVVKVDLIGTQAAIDEQVGLVGKLDCFEVVNGDEPAAGQ